MEWIEAKVDFDADTTVAAEELIADVFYRFGVKGVVVDDPAMEVPPGRMWSSRMTSDRLSMP